MAAYQFMGLCIPALLVLIPNLLAAAAIAVGAGMVGDAVAGILGGLLSGLVVLVVGGGISAIPAAIMNEACRSGYSDLAWASVAASVATAFVAGYATYRVTPTIIVGAQRTAELAKATAKAQAKTQVHQGTRTGESRRGAATPAPVSGN
jgi:predicted lipid-binding transport protein (Tim44 family)